MKKNHEATKKLNKNLNKHTDLMKNGSSLRNIGIKRLKLFISLHVCSVQNFSLFCPKYVKILVQNVFVQNVFVQKLLSKFLKSEVFVLDVSQKNITKIAGVQTISEPECSFLAYRLLNLPSFLCCAL